MAPSTPAGEAKSFGSCCRDLNEVLGAEDFDPLFYVGEDSVLYMSVGVVEMETEEESGFLDHPIYHCPFCGTRLQTVEEVEAKAVEE
jgi:hypothetical protein